MANTQYITKNRLLDDYKRSGHSAGKILLAMLASLLPLGVGLTVGISHLSTGRDVFAFSGAMAIAIGVIIAVSFARRILRRDDAILSGVEGEMAMLDELMHLPEHYVLFNQVDIPLEPGSNKVREADMLVIGRNTVFVLEAKNNNGSLIGGVKGDWTQHKVGQKGGEYSSEMRNPIAQTKKLIWLLGNHLKEKRAKAWIQGVVVLTHPEVSFDIANDSNVPVVHLSDLNDTLRVLDEKNTRGLSKEVLTHLVELKS